MTDLFKNFKNGRMIVALVAVLIGYGITGGAYLKSIEDSVVDIKELRTQYNSHEVLVLTQLGILNTEIANIHRQLTNLQRAKIRLDRRRSRAGDIAPVFNERDPR